MICKPSDAGFPDVNIIGYLAQGLYFLGGVQQALARPDPSPGAAGKLGASVTALASYPDTLPAMSTFRPRSGDPVPHLRSRQTRSTPPPIKTVCNAASEERGRPLPNHKDVLQQPYDYQIPDAPGRTTLSNFNRCSDLRPLCVSVDSQALTLHAPEGCSIDSFRQAHAQNLIARAHVPGNNSAAAFVVPPGTRNFRAEVSFAEAPHDKANPSRSEFGVRMRFKQVSGNTIFLQVKECRGQLKQAFGNACSRPAAALSITPDGVVRLATNRVHRISEVVTETTRKFEILDLSGRDQDAFFDWRMVMTWSEANPGIEVYLDGRLVFSCSEPFGASDSESHYGKTGAYVSNAKMRPLDNPTSVQADWFYKTEPF